MITSSFYPHLGGGEQQALRLSQKLIERGWNARVLTRRHNPQYPYLPPAFEEHQGVPVHRVFSPGSEKIGSLTFIVSSLWYLGRHGRNGIYHAHGIGAPATIATLAAKLLGGKSLVKLRQEGNYYTDILPQTYRRQIKFQLRYADNIVAVNGSAMEMLQAWGVPQERIRLLPNGIDTDKVSPAQEKAPVRARLLQSECDGANKTIFLFVGRVVHKKGIDLLLSAWADLPPQTRRECHLLIVGDGPEKTNLSAQCERLGIGASVKFLGRREDVIDFYHAADAVVLPSRSEGLSNVMLEAMACGLPVVCTAVGGALDWVRSGENGVLVPPEDPAALARALEQVADNREQWERMGAAARETVVASLSMDSLVEQLEQVYLSQTDLSLP